MGWKTYTGAAMVGLTGLLQMILAGVSAAQGEPLDMSAIQSGAAMIGAGLAVAGLGHKTDKATANIVGTLNQVGMAVEAAGAGAQQAASIAQAQAGSKPTAVR
jgi:hypothetical protein